MQTKKDRTFRHLTMHCNVQCCRVGCLPYSQHARATARVGEDGSVEYSDWWGYCTVLYCSVLCCTVLYCSVLCR